MTPQRFAIHKLPTRSCPVRRKPASPRSALRTQPAPKIGAYTIHPSSRASIAFFPVLFSVHGFVRLTAFALGKFFERGGRIFFTCIRSAANRPDRLVPKVGIDNFALIVLALAHNIIILRRLW